MSGIFEPASAEQNPLLFADCTDMDDAAFREMLARFVGSLDPAS
ncbi:hypothetical protein [Streptomyces hyaluromycini]|nr:hypothetical protein [Streptomyces hyaluromycini]